MKQAKILKTVFPDVITENFEFTDYKESEDSLDYWLDELGYMFREDYKKGTVREYGFTEEREIQDFPIRGKAVYLHVRRRKWRDTEDSTIFTYNYELSEEGSRLTSTRHQEIVKRAQGFQGITHYINSAIDEIFR